MIKRLYDILYHRKHSVWEYRIVKMILNIFYPFFIRFKKNHRHEKEVKGLIVSLTSFPERIETAWVVIETLLRQSYKPEKIILWLASSQFESENNLPKKLLEQRKRGLEIKFCEDIKSHKKYYYTMKAYPNHTVITVDDDIFYPENLVEELVLTSEKYPNTICCNIAHRMVINEKNQIEPYNRWETGAQGYDQPSDILVPIGAEGVLYPPGSFNSDLFDLTKIKELCPLADDLWLKSMATLNGRKAVKVKPKSIFYASILSTEKNSLKSLNVLQSRNDEQLNNIIKNYPELKNIWKLEI